MLQLFLVISKMENTVGINLLIANLDLEEQIIQLATRTVVAASIALIVLVAIAIIVKKQSEHLQNMLKLPLFLMITITMLGATGILLASTVYLNVKSDSGGPVHWHNEIEFWACGAEINLRDPVGKLSNKVGSATFHEHNDKHIHLEGVVVDLEYDASLDKFMQVTGGSIAVDAIDIPLSPEKEKWFTSEDQLDGDGQKPENFEVATGNGSRILRSEDGTILSLKNGQSCGNGQHIPAQLQVFKFTYDKSTKTYYQEKLDNPAGYTLRAESSLGPPADCVIVEFDVPKQRTNKLCEQYGIKDVSRCTEFGVSEFNPDLCDISEVFKQQPTTPTPASSLTETCENERSTTSTTNANFPSKKCAIYFKNPNIEQDCQEQAKNQLTGISSECAVISESI
jgi:hypothetical protein